MIEVLGVKNADKLVPTEDDVKPTDPVSENMNALTGTPIKAFLSQDHEAHIMAHQSIGQNPQANAIMAALQAHIAEHLGFRYRAQMEEKLGATLPPPNQELTVEDEVQLSRLISEGGKQLTAQHEQEAAQKQAQQKQQDPVVQMQQAELQIKQQEVQRKAQKDQADIQIKQAELQRKTQKDQADVAIDQAQIMLEEKELQLDTEKTVAKMAADRRKDATKLELDAVKTATDAANKQR
jgi:hypothetical protein